MYKPVFSLHFFPFKMVVSAWAATKQDISHCIDATSNTEDKLQRYPHWGAIQGGKNQFLSA